MIPLCCKLKHMVEIPQTTYFLAAPSFSGKQIYATSTSLNIYFAEQGSTDCCEKRLEDLDKLKFVSYKGRTFKVEGMLKHMEGAVVDTVWLYVVPCA
jgi:hypothetical protein